MKILKYLFIIILIIIFTYLLGFCLYIREGKTNESKKHNEVINNLIEAKQTNIDNIRTGKKNELNEIKQEKPLEEEKNNKVVEVSKEEEKQSKKAQPQKTKKSNKSKTKPTPTPKEIPKEETKVVEPERCTNIHNHFMDVGNCGKWYTTKEEGVAEFDAKLHYWGTKVQNSEIDYETYLKNCPYGYECWSCPFCEKWTLNYYYRK